jgi:hypothetical protein
MELLHTTVITTPGTPGSPPTGVYNAQDRAFRGSAILRLRNETLQENAYSIRVRCANPYWQKSWYRLQALQRPSTAASAPAAGKEDHYDAEHRYVKVYVAKGETRDIHVRFHLPALPESRCGIYDFEMVVETEIVAAGTQRAGAKQVTPLPGRLIVQPFYDWEIDVSPEERRVGRSRNKVDFDLVVTNRSNDWLYCNITVPSSKDLVIACPTQRIAVPPAEPNEMLHERPGEDAQQGLQRVLPLAVQSRLKIIKGDLTPQPLAITAQRVNAPTIPPQPEDSYTIAPTFVLVSNPSTPDSKGLAERRSVIYNPPIPNKPFEIIGRTFGSVKNFVMTLAGVGIFLVIAWHAVSWCIDQAKRSISRSTRTVLRF